MSTRLNKCVVTLFIFFFIYRCYAKEEKGLALYLKFDEGSGEAVKDDSGLGNDGAINGEPKWVKGVLENALELDGVKDWVSIENDPINSSQPFSVEFWVSPLEYKRTAWEIKLVQQRIGGNAWSISQFERNVSFTSWYAGDKAFGVSAKGVLRIGEWTHIVGVFDGKYLKIYADGELKESKEVTETLIDSSGGVQIGGDGTTQDRQFHGKIDEVRVYNRALSDEEIKANFDKPGIKKAPKYLGTKKPEERKAVKMEDIMKIQLPELSPDHPCLLFTKKDIAGILEKVKKYKWAEQGWNNILRDAEKWKNQKIEIPEKEGQWPHWYVCKKCGRSLTTVNPTEHKCPGCGEIYTGEPYDGVVRSSKHNQVANACKTLGMAYAFTLDKSYAEKAKNILLEYADKYENYPLHDVRSGQSRSAAKVLSQTLEEAVWFIPIVQGYDCIYEICNQEERSKIENKLIGPVVEVIKKNSCEGNWQSWHNGALIGAALVLKNKNFLDEIINGYHGFLYQMANHVGDDGMWYEGSWGYHFYALDALVYLTEMAYHSGIDLYKNKRFKGLFDAPILFMTPSRTLPGFHDSSLEMNINENSLYEIAYSRFEDEKFTLLIPSNRANLYALLYGKDEIKKERQILLPSTNFKDVGFAILRTSGKNKSYVAMDYGPHGGGHGHLDKLGFVYYSLGKTLAPDPGVNLYGSPLAQSWYHQTIAHNTVLVDEMSQAEATGVLEYFYPSPAINIATAHSGFAYPDALIRRTLIHTDDYLVIVDNIKSEVEHKYDWAYHNYGKLSSDLPFKEGGSLAGQGYEHLKNLRSITSKSDVSLLWEVDSSKRLKLWMTGGENTEIILADGMGNPSTQVVPMVLLRRESKETIYIVVLEPFKKDQENITSVKKGSKNLEITLKNRKDVYSWKDTSFTTLDTEGIKKLEEILAKVQKEETESLDFPVAQKVEGDTRTKSKVEITIEAEEIFQQGEGEVKIREDKIGASKKAFSNWDISGHWLEWKFNIPEEGFYTITLRYCTAGAPVRSLIIDNKYPAEHFKNIVFDSTQGVSPSDGWSNKTDDWKPYVFLDSDGKTPFRFYFKPGEHKLKMVNIEGGGMNLDYIIIKNL